ncbi:unnamed protein product, partial [Discula destructiva]
MAPKIAVVY